MNVPRMTRTWRLATQTRPPVTTDENSFFGEHLVRAGTGRLLFVYTIVKKKDMTKITRTHSSTPQATPSTAAAAGAAAAAKQEISSPASARRKAKVVIVGAAGQLGVALQACPQAEAFEVVALSRSQLDVASAESVASSDALSDASVIINAAAYTDVDGAETAPESAHLVNALGPKYLAARAKQEGAYLIHVSTDYVFGDVVRSGPSRPLQIDDDTVPNTMYGRTKLVGEANVVDSGADAVIVRTAWVWSGPTQPEAKDFVSTMIGLARGGAAEGSIINVVDDQRGNPTFVGDLAEGIWQLAERAVSGDAVRGVVHATGSGDATWFDVARAVFAAIGEDPERVRACTSAEFPRPARRPAWSVLSPDSWLTAGLSPLPEWEATLRRVLS